MKCPICNGSLGVHCPDGHWEPCVQSDKQAMKFETSCVKCKYHGHIYMKGELFPVGYYVAPCRKPYHW
jgi:hypothetical protein